MQRFYINSNISNTLWWQNFIISDNEILHQIIKVLRSSIWDNFIFFDGVRNIDFVYKITSIDKKNIIFHLVDEILKPKEVQNIHLYQAIPNKIDKIELILQKWVEVGYNSFCFFKADRSQKLFISDNKIDRLKKIIKEAVEQTGRNTIPSLDFISKLDIKNIPWDKYFFHTNTTNSKKIKDIDFKNKISLIIWPEGWFSDEEVSLLESWEVIKINLWNNILRTETTPIVVWFYINQTKIL